MTEQSYEQRAQQRLKAEIDAFENDQRAQAQQQLDHWWRTKLDLEAEHRRMMQQLNPTGLKIW